MNKPCEGCKDKARCDAEPLVYGCAKNARWHGYQEGLAECEARIQEAKRQAWEWAKTFTSSLFVYDDEFEDWIEKE